MRRCSAFRASALSRGGILKRDYPIVQGAILFISTFLVLVNLGVDLLYRVIDPGSVAHDEPLLWIGGALAASCSSRRGRSHRGRPRSDSSGHSRPHPAPSAQHPSGRTAGRDVFARVVYGARIASSRGRGGAGRWPGLLVGTVTAYYGGRVDSVSCGASTCSCPFPAFS